MGLRLIKVILIRTDANEQIGGGHVMRCLAIAHALVNKGENVIFVTADSKADGLIKSHGFENICLHSDFTDIENEQLDKVVAAAGADLLILDSYYVTERLFDTLKAVVQTAYLDDLNKSRWNTDYLINYNIYANVFDYSRYDGTRTVLLLHPRYAPLRAEFIGISGHTIKDVEDVFVSAGGADPEHISEKIMEGIVPDYPEVRFHFVVGALNPELEKLKMMAEGYANIILHINEQHMADLMKRCDIAVSAAGSTLYELCACGTPAITYLLADNQLVGGEQFEKQGIMLNAGDCRNDPGFIVRLKKTFGELMNDESLRLNLSGSMQRVVDGYGAYRIADELRRHHSVFVRRG